LEAPLPSPVALKPGDLIEISRGLYEHWAVYVGNGDVIHLAPTSEVAGAGFSSIGSLDADTAVVRRDPLWIVVGADSYRVNNKYDRRYSPQPVREIIQAAKEAVGRVMPYSVFSKNCEHFVTSLRYGVAKSDQVSILGIVGLAAVATATVLIGRVLTRRHEEKDD
uniref:LRAT domain-containing protein n=1 Tax=Sphenodon punctatus TaxID=8508 RepID=A0A8D0GLM0_SPHPU